MKLFMLFVGLEVSIVETSLNQCSADVRYLHMYSPEIFGVKRLRSRMASQELLIIDRDF